MLKIFENQEEDCKILNFQSLKMRDIIELCQKINEMYENGYKIEENFIPRECPKIPRILNLKFVKKDFFLDRLEDETPDEEVKKVIRENIDSVKSGDQSFIVVPTKEVSLNDLTKKDELLEYASDHNIEVPEEMKLPSQIKKFIKENTTNTAE